MNARPRPLTRQTDPKGPQPVQLAAQISPKAAVKAGSFGFSFYSASTPLYTARCKIFAPRGHAKNRPDCRSCAHSALSHCELHDATGSSSSHHSVRPWLSAVSLHATRPSSWWGGRRRRPKKICRFPSAMLGIEAGEWAIPCAGVRNRGGRSPNPDS